MVKGEKRKKQGKEGKKCEGKVMEGRMEKEWS